jgi:hypothetical protein
MPRLPESKRCQPTMNVQLAACDLDGQRATLDFNAAACRYYSTGRAMIRPACLPGV